MSLSKFREMVKGREAWRAAVHGIEKSWTRLNEWTANSTGNTVADRIPKWALITAEESLRRARQLHNPSVFFPRYLLTTKRSIVTTQWKNLPTSTILISNQGQHRQQQDSSTPWTLEGGDSLSMVFLPKCITSCSMMRKHQVNQNEGAFYNLYFVMTSQIVDWGPWLFSASHSVFHILQNNWPTSPLSKC